jgi:putative DNA primase/helicase
VTSDDYADRKLGESQRVRFKNRTRVVLTGNNVTLASDNARRTLVCSLQLLVESPRDRKIDFEIPALAAYIKEHRARLIVAALTVLRAYAIQPNPLMLPPLESFEDWSWRVRDALIWLGQEDPVAAVQFENDGTAEIAMAFGEIEAIANAKRRTSSSQPAQFRASDIVNWAAINPALRDALEVAGCADTSSAGKVGYWLRALKNRVVSDRRLVCYQVDGGRQPNKWAFEPLNRSL